MSDDDVEKKGMDDEGLSVDGSSADIREIEKIVSDPALPANEKAKRVVRTFMSIQMESMQMSRNSPASTLFQKMTSEHISAYLQSSDKDMELSHKSDMQNRIVLVIVILIVVTLFGVIIFVFQNNPDFVEKILFTVGGAIVGAIGGFGFGKSRG